MQRDVSVANAAVDWWWLGPGLLLILVPMAAFATRWGAIRASHPAYTILLSIVIALGLLLTWRGVGHKARRGTRSRVLTRIALIALAIALGGLTWTLRPLAATEIAVAAMADGQLVAVTQTSTRISLFPTQGQKPAELVFYPGGLVDPRAYVNVLRPIAEAGYPVTIIKPPLGFAFLARGPDFDRDASRATIVGGHSLGGVAAALKVNDRAEIDGLLLWAAYPAGSIADRTDLATMSVFGSEDGLTTPSDVAGSRADLPASTAFVEIVGAVHSHFGDYGEQRGDGTPTISRGEAQVQIVAATLSLFEDLLAPGAP
ncbi:MAG: alpha/beta hydrolase [Acidimicrobiia bacterium]|nr:alpha/beta hydrolase [Acidimicrobiia bacterium]